MREHGGWDNVDMILIAGRAWANSLDARQIDGGHVEDLNSTLSRIVPSRTDTEWREENKEHLAINDKQWREEDKEQYQAQRKEYRDQDEELIKHT